MATGGYGGGGGMKFLSIFSIPNKLGKIKTYIIKSFFVLIAIISISSIIYLINGYINDFKKIDKILKINENLFTSKYNGPQFKFSMFCYFTSILAFISISEKTISTSRFVITFNSLVTGL